jgi:hypothetical protein
MLNLSLGNITMDFRLQYNGIARKLAGHWYSRDGMERPGGGLALDFGNETKEASQMPVDTPRAPNSKPKSSANVIATVIDPPSNIRVTPSAASGIICSVGVKRPISILGSQGNWYKTDICGGRLGYIHRSQIKF